MKKLKFLIIYLFIAIIGFQPLIARNIAILFAPGRYKYIQDNVPHYDDPLYWTGLFIVYEYLIEKAGYTHDDIYVFYSRYTIENGINVVLNEEDNVNALGRYRVSQKNYPLRNDKWSVGTNDIRIVDYQAADFDINNTSSPIYDVKSNIQENDNLIIWCRGHGEPYEPLDPDGYSVKNHVPPLIGEPGEWTEQQLINFFDQIPCRRKILWNSCYSGKLIEGLVYFNLNNSIILTSVKYNSTTSFGTENRNGIGVPGFTMSVFSCLYSEERDETIGHNGPLGWTYRKFNTCPPPYNDEEFHFSDAIKDFNEDGVISMYELYESIKYKDDYNGTCATQNVFYDWSWGWPGSETLDQCPRKGDDENNPIGYYTFIDENLTIKDRNITKMGNTDNPPEKYYYKYRVNKVTTENLTISTNNVNNVYCGDPDVIFCVDDEIHFKDGTEIKDGASIHAYVQTTPNSFWKQPFIEEPKTEKVITRKEYIEVYPNPVGNNAKINYYLSEKEIITLKIYNIFGEEIITLADGFQNAGTKQINWNVKDSRGNKVNLGMYILKLQTGNKLYTNKIMVK